MKVKPQCGRRGGKSRCGEGRSGRSTSVAWLSEEDEKAREGVGAGGGETEVRATREQTYLTADPTAASFNTGVAIALILQCCTFRSLATSPRESRGCRSMTTGVISQPAPWRPHRVARCFLPSILPGLSEGYCGTVPSPPLFALRFVSIVVSGPAAASGSER